MTTRTTDQQIAELLSAIGAKVNAFAKKHKVAADMRSFSSKDHLVIQTGFEGDWETAAILERATGRFLKGGYNARKGKLTVHAKQPKAAPTITNYTLNGFGDIKGIPNKRVFVLSSYITGATEVIHATDGRASS